MVNNKEYGRGCERERERSINPESFIYSLKFVMFLCSFLTILAATCTTCKHLNLNSQHISNCLKIYLNREKLWLKINFHSCISMRNCNRKLDASDNVEWWWTSKHVLISWIINKCFQYASPRLGLPWKRLDANWRE